MSSNPSPLRLDATSDAPADLRFQWVREETDFRELKEEWNVLADRNDSVFLRHEWFDAAWQWRKRDCQLALLCIRRGNRLVGVAPLLRSQGRRRRLRVRSLELLTVPDTQNCDILVAAEHRDAVCDVIAQALAVAPFAWDVIDLGYLREEAFASDRLLPILRERGFAVRRREQSTNLFIDLTTSWEAFYAKRSRRLKKANNLIANRLQRAADMLAIERLPGGNESTEEIKAACDTVVSISAKSWKSQTGLSLDQPGPQAFFRRLTEVGLAQGWLALWLLRVDRVAVAMELQLNYGGQVHALRADFDESFKTLSPGSYLNWKLLESLFGRNLRRYWFGPGENSYKRHWTDVGEPLYTASAYGRTVRGRWLGMLETVVIPRLRRWLRRDSRKPSDAPVDANERS